MKLLRYGPPGQEKPGLLDKTGKMRDLSIIVDDIGGKTLLRENLNTIQRLELSHLPEIPENSRIGPCVTGVGKILGIGLNYADHAAETGATPPKEPLVFYKATTAISGPYDPIELPPNSTHLDWEVELGVVIGKPAKYIEQKDALDHIAGYCVVNDFSERFLQKERGGEWLKGKSADTFAPIGPWFVTANEIPDPQNLSLWLEVDGQRQQDSSTKHMVFSVSYLVAYLSHFTRLQTGDIITTGTPAGVGMGKRPPQYLQSGQTLRLGVQGLGEQHYSIR